MTRRVTEADLRGKSKWELDVMRNEIYARYGRGFDRSDLQEYFYQQPWYVRKYDPEDFPVEILTDIQNYNALFILEYSK